MTINKEFFEHFRVAVDLKTLLYEEGGICGQFSADTGNKKPHV